MTYSSLVFNPCLWACIYTKNSWHQGVVDQQMYNYFDIHLYWWDYSLGGWHSLFCTTNNRLCVAIRTCATTHQLLSWVTTMRQLMTCLYRGAFRLNFTLYWWTTTKIHKTLIVINRYLRLMGDKTTQGLADRRLNYFYPPLVAGIDLPHHDVVDCNNFDKQIHIGFAAWNYNFVTLSSDWNWGTLLNYSYW